MTINRLNYEKYAIDYLDGTLSTDLREEMMAFLNAHPDIREEVEWQQQFTAPVLTAISHPDKSKLLKSEPVIRQLKPIYWIAAAASVLLLIAFGLFWKPQQDNHPMASGDKQIAPASEASKQIAEQQEEPGQQIAETPTFKQDLVESPAATTSAESNPIKQQDFSSPKTKPRRSSVQVAQHSTDLPSIPETPNRESESVITDQPDREIALLETTPTKDEALAQTETATRETAFIALPNPIETLPTPEEINPIAESAVALSAPVSQSEGRNRLNILKRMLRPEAFAGADESFSIRESVIPEAFAGLFSKD